MKSLQNFQKNVPKSKFVDFRKSENRAALPNRVRCLSALRRVLDKNRDLSCFYLSRVLKKALKAKNARVKPKTKSKWSPPKTNKAATTTTKRTRLENKAAEIKMQTMRQTIYT